VDVQQVDRVDVQPRGGRLRRRAHPLGRQVVRAQLRRDGDGVRVDVRGGDARGDGGLVAVLLGGVDVAVPRLDGGTDRGGGGLGRIQQVGPEADRRELHTHPSPHTD
jgi:hypothetical protein